MGPAPARAAAIRDVRSAARVRGWCLSAGCAGRGAGTRLGLVRSGINVMSYRFVKT
jgi:hypothetical protein